jgi:hypothetical protein
MRGVLLFGIADLLLDSGARGQRHRRQRGEDATGVRQLRAEPGGREQIGRDDRLLQVDLTVMLSDGQQRTVPLQSAYREGVLYPIAPGGKAVLKQPLDLSRARSASAAATSRAGGRPYDLRGRRQDLHLVGVGTALESSSCAKQGRCRGNCDRGS